MTPRVSDERLSFARRLRQEMTGAETMLWRSLRNRGIAAKFRRQFPSVLTLPISPAWRQDWSSNSMVGRMTVPNASSTIEIVTPGWPSRAGA